MLRATEMHLEGTATFCYHPVRDGRRHAPQAPGPRAVADLVRAVAEPFPRVAAEVYLRDQTRPLVTCAAAAT